MLRNNQQVSIRSQALFLILLVVTILAAKGLQLLLHIILQPAVPDVSILLDSYMPYVFPKPVERDIFLILGMAIPILAIFLTRKAGWVDPMAGSKLASLVLPLAITLLLFLPLIHSDFFSLIVPKYGTYKEKVTIIPCLITAALWCFWVVYSRSSFKNQPLIRAIVWICIISSMLLLIGAWRIVGMNGMIPDDILTTHLDAALHATTQVIAGKTLLVDIPSQYGLFPELIAPLLRTAKATILNFSLFFAFLQAVSLLGLFFVLSKCVKNSTLLLLACISLLLVTNQTILHFHGSNDRYLQYWPIRFFWPAFSVFTFYWFAIKKTFWRGALVSAVGAIGTFWVLDTGLFIPLAFAAYLIAKLIISFTLPANGFVQEKDCWFYAKTLILHLFVTVIILTLLLGALWLKAQQPLHLSWMFKYQKIFYGLGFFMSPLPPVIHPWMSVLAIYLFGLIVGLVACYQQSSNTRADILLYLSMLGLGLFVYYEGRSHVVVLLIVCWPALMIMSITADRTLNYIRSKQLTLSTICMPIATVTFLLVCSIDFVINIPTLVEQAKNQFLTRNIPNYPLTNSELAFIKQHTKPKDECLILSKRQAIYYAESGLVSPINGPGLAETLLKTDLEKTIKPLIEGKITCVFLGINESSPVQMGLNLVELTDKLSLENLRQKYKVVSQNAEHTMFYLTPNSG
ncbi:MAG: hypothetical protein H0U57_09800 [Tatlockia sp.]|nr:hypothetical protein [Tatlockia sp.]